MSDLKEYEIVEVPKGTPIVLLVRDDKGVRISRYANLNTDDLAIMSMFLSAWTQNTMAEKIRTRASTPLTVGDIQ